MDKPDFEKIEQARQDFMQGKMSAESYWAIRVAEYSKWK